MCCGREPAHLVPDEAADLYHVALHVVVEHFQRLHAARGASSIQQEPSATAALRLGCSRRKKAHWRTEDSKGAYTGLWLALC